MNPTNSFKKPDLNAPRFRPDVLSLLNRKLFDKFIAEYPEYKGMDCEDFKKIINTFNRNLSQTAISDRDGVELPESMGFIFIGSCQPPRRKANNINYGLSIKHNTTVLNRNLGSDSFLAKIFYTNCSTKYRFQHREVWQFVASKEFAKNTSIAYKEDWKKYIQVENNLKISKLYRKNGTKDWAVRIRDDKPAEDYNEFELD